MRAIDADALKDTLENLADDEWNQSTSTTWASAFASVTDIVDDAPTIEPEYKEIDFVQPHKKLPVNLKLERKKGKWMHDKDDMIISGYCSCCGWTAAIMETDVAGMPFCPNCGAEMTERKEDASNR